jgi:hypothetical protein
MRLAKPVPGTNILAYITTKHPVLKFIPHFAGNYFLLQLNGEVRNTFAAINGFIG